MTRYFAVAGVQMTISPGNTEANISKIKRYVKSISAAFPWVDMVCFSEFAITGFHPLNWKKQSELIPGTTSDKLCNLAKAAGKWIMPGSMFEKDGDRTYNSAFIISPNGEIVSKYRKMFPWFHVEQTSPGDKFCVFDIPNVGRFGLCICYDMWFPEVARNLMWMGVEVILHPTMTPSSLGLQERVVAQANAIFNQCYFVNIGGVGNHGGLTLSGHSVIIDPEGRILQEAGDNQTVIIEILDLDNVTKTREYGTVGFVQLLKHLRELNHKFSIYEDLKSGEIYKKLGQSKLHKKIKPLHK